LTNHIIVELGWALAHESIPNNLKWVIIG